MHNTGELIFAYQKQSYCLFWYEHIHALTCRSVLTHVLLVAFLLLFPLEEAQQTWIQYEGKVLF